MELHGNGYILQLEKGKSKGRCRKWRLWQATDEGKRSRVYHGTWTGAQAALEDFRRELAGRVTNADTVGDYARAWTAYRSQSGDYAPGTIANDARSMRMILRSPLADMRMDSVTPTDCKNALSWMRDNPAKADHPLSGTTMNKVAVTMHAMFGEAADDGLIAASPMQKIKAPRPDTAEKRWMGDDELRAFVDGLAAREPSQWLVAVMLMSCLGLRRAEACALMDRDVDTVRRVARVRFAVKEANGRVAVPKSPAGKRTLPMSEQLCEYVDRWRSVKREKGLGDAMTLACNSRGGVLRPQNLYKWWERHKAELGAAGYTMHQLRHSNLSMMARFMSPFDLQRWAGWSSLAPARIYIHEDLDSMRAAVARSQVRGGVIREVHSGTSAAHEKRRSAEM